MENELKRLRYAIQGAAVMILGGLFLTIMPSLSSSVPTTPAQYIVAGGAGFLMIIGANRSFKR